MRRKVAHLRAVPTSRLMETYEVTEWVYCEACEEPHHVDEVGVCEDACSPLYTKVEQFRPQKAVPNVKET